MVLLPLKQRLVLSVTVVIPPTGSSGSALQMLGGHGDISCDGHTAVTRCRVHGHLSDHDSTHSEPGTEAHLFFFAYVWAATETNQDVWTFFFYYYYSNASCLSKHVEEVCILFTVLISDNIFKRLKMKKIMYLSSTNYCLLFIGLTANDFYRSTLMPS